MLFSVVSNFSTTLAQSMTSSQGTLVLTSATVQGHALTSADYGSYLYFTINPGASNCEIVRGDSNSGTTFTLGKRGLAWYGSGDTELSAFKFAHNAGEPVIISNAKNVYDNLVDNQSDETINGIKTFTSSPIVPTPTTDFQAATKKYADDLAIAGSPDASSTTKGISKLTLDPVSPTNPIAVGDNDTSATSSGSKVVRGTAGKIAIGWLPAGTASGVASLNGSTLVVENPANATATPAATKIPIADSSGLLDTWVSYDFFFGTGADGDATISSPTTLTADKHYNNLTLNAALNAGGYKIFVKGTLTQGASGKITNNGGNGGAGTDGAIGAAGTAGSAGAAAPGLSLPAGVAGVVGVNGVAPIGDGSTTGGTAGTVGLNASSCLLTSNGVQGGAGGGYSGATGSSAAGAAGTSTLAVDKVSTAIDAFTLIEVAGTTVAIYRPSAGSSSGGSAGAANGTGVAARSGGSGGSGATGGFVFVFAKNLVLQNSGNWIEAKGGDGGKGGNGYSGGGSSTSGGSGGGGGGNGGVVLLGYKTKSGTSVPTVAGGAFGGSGTKTTVGAQDGGTGTAGNAGVIYTFAL